MQTYLSAGTFFVIVAIVALSGVQQVAEEQLAKIDGGALCTVQKIDPIGCKLESDPELPCGYNSPLGTSLSGWKNFVTAVDPGTHCITGSPYFCVFREGEKLRDTQPPCTPVYVPPYF